LTDSEGKPALEVERKQASSGGAIFDLHDPPEPMAKIADLDVMSTFQLALAP
jgi:hypothetical protein